MRTAAEIVSDVQPLHLALAEMRDDLSRTSPDSLKLFNTFESWVLAWAANPNALTNRVWLADRWKCYFGRRWDEIFSDMQSRVQKRHSLAGVDFKASLAESRDLLRAFVQHLGAKHPLVSSLVRSFVNAIVLLVVVAASYAVFATLSVRWHI